MAYVFVPHDPLRSVYIPRGAYSMIPFGRTLPAFRASDLESLTNRLVLLALFTVGALVMSQNQSDPDLWGHLQYGQDAMRLGLPEFATYTYTAPHHPWVNHEWATERLLAVGWETVGGRGLLVFKCLLGLAFLFVVYRRNRSAGIAWLPAAALMLAIGVNLMLSWKLRPQLLSFWLLTFTLWLLDRAFHRTPEGRVVWERPIRYRYLWAIPLLMAAWTNLHGAFAAGIAIVGLYLAGRAGQLAVRRRRAAARDVLLLAAVVAATMAATLVNPYTWQLHVWLWHSLSVPRPEIVEWRPPELLHPAFFPFWALVVGAAAAAWKARRKMDWVETLVLAALLWQACRYQRHIPLFVIAAAWWMPHAWRELLRRQPCATMPSRRGAAPPAMTLLVAFLALVATLFIGNRVVARCQAIVVRGWDYPVDAFQFIEDHRLEGRMVVQFMWAQYALAAFGDHDDPHGERKLTVAFDGRFRTCYPQHVVDMYFDFASGLGEGVSRYRSPTSPPFDPARILEYGRPNLVLIRLRRKHAHRVMTAHRDEWVVLYRDSMAELWGRRSWYDDPWRPTYIPENERIIRDDEPWRVVAFPAFPRVRRTAEPWAASSPVGRNTR